MRRKNSSVVELTPFGQSYGLPVHRNLTRDWVLVAFWLALIATESTEAGASYRTLWLLQQVLTPVFGEIARWRLEVLNMLLRKAGHLIGYGILGYLFFRAWRTSLRTTVTRVWERRWAILALLSTLLVAFGDELHQSRMASRTGTVVDVVLDMLGAITFQLAIVFALAPVVDQPPDRVSADEDSEAAEIRAD